MNGPLEKLNGLLHAAGLAVVLCAAGLAYWFAYRPLQLQCGETLARRDEIAGLLQNVDQLRAQRDRLRKALADAAEEQAALLARLPDAPREADFLRQISGLADEVDLKLRDYRPGEVHKQTSYSEMEIGLTCEGSYQGLCRFLDGLARLPRLVNLEQLDITDQRSDGVYPASMTLVIYFGAESKADVPERQAPMAKLKLEGSSITPRQWGLIGVLGAVLAGAIYWPSDEGGMTGDDATAAAGQASAGPRVPRRLAARPSQSTRWPQPELDAALAYDPFSSPQLSPKAPPPVAEEPEKQDDGAELLALRQDGVSMIVRDAGGIVATVGERKLRVGDVIDGYRVVAIEMDGVVLERVQAE